MPDEVALGPPAESRAYFKSGFRSPKLLATKDRNADAQDYRNQTHHAQQRHWPHSASSAR
jgi:hypothetical protein